MSESEEIKLEYEITQLQKHPERILIISKRPQYNPSTCEFHIEITFPETNYIFILQISLTNHYIHLYSKNFHPLNDGRDLIRLAYPNLPLNNSYSPDKINLKIIIEMLTILTQSSQIKQNKLFNSIGNFYIGNEYDVNIIKSIDHLFKHNIIIIENVNGVVSTETISLCTISNDYFCLYDYDNSHVHKFTLSFYSSLTALSSFKMSSDSSVLTLMWKQKGSSIPYEMQLTASLLYEDDVNVIEHIVALLINLFKERGVKMDINKKHNGVLPNINIDKIEEEIQRYENQMKYSSNFMLFNKLITHYEKAIEFYSALNDAKYNEYTKKIQNLLLNESFSKYYTNNYNK